MPLFKTKYNDVKKAISAIKNGSKYDFSKVNLDSSDDRDKAEFLCDCIGRYGIKILEEIPFDIEKDYKDEAVSRAITKYGIKILDDLDRDNEWIYESQSVMYEAFKQDRSIIEKAAPTTKIHVLRSAYKDKVIQENDPVLSSLPSFDPNSEFDWSCLFIDACLNQAKSKLNYPVIVTSPDAQDTGNTYIYSSETDSYQRCGSQRHHSPLMSQINRKVFNFMGIRHEDNDAFCTLFSPKTKMMYIHFGYGYAIYFNVDDFLQTYKDRLTTYKKPSGKSYGSVLERIVDAESHGKFSEEFFLDNAQFVLETEYAQQVLKDSISVETEQPIEKTIHQTASEHKPSDHELS